jgi:DNA-binding transcriptional regulator GbsR (MarR family)
MVEEVRRTGSWEEEKRRFIEAGGNTTQAFGLGQMIGRVFSLLYLTARPLALEEIAAGLSISKGSASVAVRQLAGWQAVRPVWVPGDRRDFYEAETDFGQIVREGLLPAVRKKLQSAGAQIGRTLAAEEAGRQAREDGEGLGEIGDREELEELRRRLRTAAKLHQRLDGLLANKLLSRMI